MRCKRCNGGNFQRDDNTGNSFCSGCGTLQEYDNYEAQLGGLKGPVGTYIRVGYIGKGSVLAYKEKKIYEANNLIVVITERLNLGSKVEAIKSMVNEITDGEFGQGEWFSVLIGACCYAVIRKEGKCVLPMEEIAVAAGCDLHQLGSMVKRVVEHLGLELGEFDLVGLFTKTANDSSRLSGVDSEKKEKITKQGAFLMNCALKWFLSTGRRPMPLVVAVLAFVCQVNGVKLLKIEDLAKDAGVSLTTCKKRYKELSEKLVKVAEEVGLPWWKDVNTKNVVKHSETLIGFMEAKSMRKRKEGRAGEIVSSAAFCLKDIIRDCLSKDALHCYDDDNDGQGQDSMSRYFSVGGETQLSFCNNDDSNSMCVRRPVFGMVSSEDWWKGKSKLSQKLLLKQVLEKDVGLNDVLPPSYIKGCVAVERRRNKIKAAKLRINAIKHPSEVRGHELSLEVEDSSNKKKRKRGSEIDWEDLIIQTLVLHNVKDEEIEKGHYNTLLDLHVFNSGGD